MKKRNQIKWLLVLATAVYAVALPALGDSILDVSIQPDPLTVNAGSSAMLEVLLKNDGTSDVNIGGFSFALTTTDSDVTFESADTNTSLAAYIFSTDSLFGPNINTSSPGQQIEASDLASDSGITLSMGQTVSLGEVIFDVSASAAPGSFGIVFNPFPSTSLSDIAGANIDIHSFSNASVTVNPSMATPEPGSALLLATGLACLVPMYRKRQRKANCPFSVSH